MKEIEDDTKKWKKIDNVFLLLFPQHTFFFSSTVQHGDPVTHTCIHNFFSHCHAPLYLDIVLSGTQEDLLLIHSKSNSLHPLTPSSQSLPLPPSPRRQPQVYSPSLLLSFLWKCSLVLYIRFQL